MSTTATLTVPRAAAAGATRIPRAAALVCTLLALGAAVVAVVGAVAGEPLVGAAGGAGLVVWGGLGGLAWRAARRAARRPLVAGGVIAAALPDGVALGPGAVLPYSALAGVALHWFSIPSRASAHGVGGALGAGLVGAAYAAAGGNLGLAVCLYPREESWLGVVPRDSGLPLAVARDPGGRGVVTVKGHRLLVDGDLGAFATALAAGAGRYGVPVSGGSVPPAQAPVLPDWLR